MEHEGNLEKAFENLKNTPNYAQLKAAVVIDFDKSSASCQLKNGQLIKISMDHIKWARAQLKKGARGRMPSLPNDVLDIGDIIYVKKDNKDQWHLSQIPEVEGALVSLHPVDGRLLALVGGFRFHKSHYNRALQAFRQSGSCFKPFIYSAALEKGYTLASIINDAPVVMNDPSQDNYMWRPENSSRQFNGPTRLRLGLIRSRNLVSIRLLESIGLDYAIRFIERFGFDKNMIPRSLSLALGSAEVSPLDLTTGIASFANGGYKINPYLIDTIVDTYGETILQSQPVKACIECIQDPELIHQIPLVQRAEQIISPQVAYLMNVALKDAIQSGTGRRAKVLKRNDIAGKTGTTNDQVDAWFTGFNTQIASTVWVGFDNPKSLYEYGNLAALPIWIDFMKGALANKPETHLPEPTGIITMRIDPETGLLAGADHPKSIFETFRQEYAPTHIAPIKSSENISVTEPEEIEHLF